MEPVEAKAACFGANFPWAGFQLRGAEQAAPSERWFFLAHVVNVAGATLAYQGPLTQAGPSTLT